MTNFSVAGIGMYVTLITFALSLVGIIPAPGVVESGVTGAVALAGFVVFVVGQLRRPDLHLGLVRKF